MTNKALEDGLLDGLGHSQRFVHPYKLDDAINKNSRKNYDRKSKRIDSKIKYGKNRENSKNYGELTTGDLIRIASGFNQAIVKVTSYGKGAYQILKHLAYISRDFDLPLEAPEQTQLTKHEEITDLISSWQSIYFDNRKNSRDTLHMVFSAPPGTCRESFKQLTSEFLHEEYSGEHDYLFVPHNDTEHPHIHSVICMRSIQGKKLDPRKEYLSILRKRFAAKCREQGIFVEASRRFERGLSGKSVKSELLQMRSKRQEMPVVDKQLVERVKTEIASNQWNDTGEKVRQSRNARLKNKFYQTAHTLYEIYMGSSETKRQDKDIQAAKLLLDFSKKFPTEVTRSDYLKEKLLTSPTSSITPFDFLGLSNSFDKKNKQKVDLEINGE